MKNGHQKRAAIVLSGCGVFDGSEIHEAVVAILNFQKRGAKVSFFAPDIEQAHTVNHLTGKPTDERRSVLAESARIARGDISSLSEFRAENFDVLFFPGGFGAAKNLCTFAFDGAGCKVNADVEKAVRAMLALKKPIGFICISPVIAAKVIGSGVRLTIGNDASTAAAINAMGAFHVDCPASSFVRDAERNVYSSPAYMLARDAAEVDAGVSAMIGEMLGL